MTNIDPYELTYVITAFLFQVVLITHFALRKWRFHQAIHYGRIVYALSIPAVVVSIVLILNHAPWYFWISGVMYLMWAIFGYWIEYVDEIDWRTRVRWTISIPYISLYLSTVMLYWWPLGLVYRPLWYINSLLFLTSTYLNVTSHKRGEFIAAKEKNSPIFTITE